MADDQPRLNLHIEPKTPIEVDDLSAALGSLARQYERFATEEGFVDKAKHARLLVSSVSHGSIDISFLPEITAAGVAMLPFFDKLEIIEKFAKRVRALLDWLAGKADKPANISINVKDCDDATNIANPIAKSGGTQNFCIINGGLTVNVLQIDTAAAKEIVERAGRERSLLKNPAADIRQRVPMIWAQLDRDEAKVDGKRSPDRATIPEIDMKSHPVFFTDEMSRLKSEMIGDTANPYQQVYFVDVEVVTINSRVVAYRVIGYHGKEDLQT